MSADVCVCVYVRVVRLPRKLPPLYQVLHIVRTYYMKWSCYSKNDFLAVLVIWKIWFAKMVLPWLTPQNL